MWENVLELNYFLAELIRGFAKYNFVDSLLVFLAEYVAFAIPLMLIAMWLYNDKGRKDSHFVFLTTVIGIGFSHILGLFFYHPRPFEIYQTLLTAAPGNTFPSQHAATMFTVAIALLYRNRLELGVFFAILALLNSFARISVGYHFPLDIIGGLFAAIIALIIMKPVEKYLDRFYGFAKKKVSGFSHVFPKDV